MLSRFSSLFLSATTISLIGSGSNHTFSQRYGLCHVPQTVKLPVAEITVFAASLVAEAKRWELRLALFAETYGPSDVQQFFDKSRLTDKVDADRVFGTSSGDLRNYTSCVTADIDDLFMVQMIQVTLDGSGWVTCHVFKSAGGTNFLYAHCICNEDLTNRTSHISGYHLRNFYFTILLRLQKFNLPIGMLMCERLLPPVQVAACSQPLYDHPHLQSQHATVLQDWLSYHHAIGVQRFSIYDIDGSMALAGGLDWVQYWPKWLPTGRQDRVSGRLQYLWSEYPLCLQMFAYTHCLIDHFGVADWVLLLHAPDEYMSQHFVNTGFISSIAHEIESMISDLKLERGSISEVHFDMFSYAATKKHDGHGSVIASSLIRAARPDPFRGVPALNPQRCLDTNGHWCTSSNRPGASHSYLKGSVLHPDSMYVNHYVEMLERDQGRCNRMEKENGGCHVKDDSLLWALPVIRASSCNVVAKRQWHHGCVATCRTQERVSRHLRRTGVLRQRRSVAWCLTCGHISLRSRTFFIRNE